VGYSLAERQVGLVVGTKAAHFVYAAYMTRKIEADKPLIVESERTFWAILLNSSLSDDAKLKVRDFVNSVRTTAGCFVTWQRSCMVSMPEVLPGGTLLAIRKDGDLELYLERWKIRDSRPLTNPQGIARNVFFDGLRSLFTFSESKLATQYPLVKVEEWLPKAELLLALIKRLWLDKRDSLADAVSVGPNYDQKLHFGKTDTPREEVILEVGADGGSFTLFRVVDTAGVRRFRFGRDEMATYDMLSEEDRASIGKEQFVESNYCDSLEDALKLLDRYRWFGLYPIEVHPEFRDAILLEVKARGGADEEKRWRER
jgi:hypothetical protein